jgi:hypothetical protein
VEPQKYAITHGCKNERTLEPLHYKSWGPCEDLPPQLAVNNSAFRHISTSARSNILFRISGALSILCSKINATAEKRQELSSGTTWPTISINGDRAGIVLTRWISTPPSVSAKSGPLALDDAGRERVMLGFMPEDIPEGRTGSRVCFTVWVEVPTADAELDGLLDVPLPAVSLTIIWSPLFSPRLDTGSSGMMVSDCGG